MRRKQVDAPLAKADKIVSDKNNYSYLVLEEEKVATEEHKNLFIQKRLVLEKKKDEFRRSKYNFELPKISDSEFKELAEIAWNTFIGEFTNSQNK